MTATAQVIRFPNRKHPRDLEHDLPFICQQICHRYWPTIVSGESRQQAESSLDVLYGFRTMAMYQNRDIYHELDFLVSIAYIHLGYIK